VRRVAVVAASSGLAGDVAQALARAGYAAFAARLEDDVWRSDEPTDALVVDAAAAAQLARAQDGALASWPSIVVMGAGGADVALEDLARLRARARVEVLGSPFGVAELEAGVASALCARARVESAGDDVESRLRESIALAAASDATVLVRGESGSGTTTVARAIHRASRDGDGPLVEVDARAANGAAGAALLRAAFETACASGIARGAVLVDRLTELDSALQSTLVELLAARSAPRAPRWIATATRSLAEAVREGRLRAELAYRFEVLVVEVPALRERGQATARIARELLRDASRRLGVREPELDHDALAALAALPLRGNIAELAALMERAALLFAGRRIEFAELSLSSPPSAPTLVASTLDLRELEEAAIGRALLQAAGNRVRAAELLGISVKTLRNKIRRYGLADVGRAGRPALPAHSG